ERLERTRDLMNAHTRDALVTEFDDLIEVLALPDPNDRHVLAAAIKGHADLIVTANLKDFPNEVLKRWGIKAQHPDEFLTHQFHLSQPAFLTAVKTVRLRLKNPPKSVGDYLDTLPPRDCSPRSMRSHRSVSLYDRSAQSRACI